MPTGPITRGPTRSADHPRPQISVIVPALNEARALGATLDVLAGLPGVVEVIVVDGGSLDKTVAVARTHGACLLHANRGRGVQMHAGAQAARGDILWFVHADTCPPAEATCQIVTALANSRVSGGCFAVHFDSAGRPAGFLARLYAHLRRLGLCYGDATLFVRRGDYERLGGFRSFPLFEDLEFVARLRQRGRFVCMPTEVVTSSRRFEGRSFVLTLSWWMILQALYWAGVPPRVLARMYAPIRSRPSGERRRDGAFPRGVPPVRFREFRDSIRSKVKDLFQIRRFQQRSVPCIEKSNRR